MMGKRFLMVATRGAVKRDERAMRVAKAVGRNVVTLIRALPK